MRSSRSRRPFPLAAIPVVALLATALALTPALAGKPAGPGDAAPDLEMLDLAGKAWSLRSLEGRVVHVAFVAVWCEPCRQEARDLRDLWLRHRRAGYTVLVVGVPSRQTPERLRAWAAQTGLDRLPLIYDGKGEATTSLGADLLPHHVIIDRKGRVDRTDGVLGRELVDRVEELLAARPRG